MRCDWILGRSLRMLQLGFNPYWVFQCAATPGSGVCLAACAEVSIPIGFSNALRPDVFLLNVCAYTAVSIPIGFSNALRHILIYAVREPRNTVSIPIGFSNALRPGMISMIFLYIVVSIPIGFSNALRRPLPNCHGPDRIGFNPYWVFQCAATR